MFIVLLSKVAAGCEPVTPSFELLTPPRAGQGVWFDVGWEPTVDDFAVTTNGEPVQGELQTYTDVGGLEQRTFALFVPSEAFVEGEPWEISLPAGYPDFEKTEVQSGIVEPAADVTSPRIDGVTFGEAFEGGGADCFTTGTMFRPVEVAMSAGTGVVVLTDDALGEVVKVGYVDGAAATLVYYREGGSADLTCLSADVIRSDGGTLSVAAVCSDQGNVCDCSSTGGAAMGWLSATLVHGLRRGRRPSRTAA